MWSHVKDANRSRADSIQHTEKIKLVYNIYSYYYRKESYVYILFYRINNLLLLLYIIHIDIDVLVHASMSNSLLYYYYIWLVDR